MAWMINLPVDLVLVRHGESEGNLYDRMDKKGARDKLHDRHTSQFRLTDLGRVQAGRAGQVIKDHFGTFDKMYCSEYVRAFETAAHMELAESNYQMSGLIREVDSCNQRGVENPLEDYTKSITSMAKWWVKPPGGESYADLCLRLRSFLGHLQENCAGLKVLVVCHAHVIRGFRALFESAKGKKLDEVLEWEIPNCHVRWYSRREATGNIHMRMYKCVELNMVKSLDITRKDAECTSTESFITRPLLDAATLKALAEDHPQMLNTEDAEDERARKRQRGEKVDDTLKIPQ